MSPVTIYMYVVPLRGTFIAFKFILRLFSVLASCFKMPCNSMMLYLAVKGNRLKFGMWTTCSVLLVSILAYPVHVLGTNEHLCTSYQCYLWLSSSGVSRSFDLLF